MPKTKVKVINMNGVSLREIAPNGKTINDKSFEEEISLHYQNQGSKYFKSDINDILKCGCLI